ncbi:hypothetical protein C4577_03085 [Candidatus Parcubacteria bacterium]|nr:MAG: hypothetical protein C4577_03085 [Candidatus Parcubacteria bacterium]
MIILLFCLLTPLEPIDVTKFIEPVPYDEVSSWIIKTHGIFEFTPNNQLVPLCPDEAIEAQYINEKWLIRYKDGMERIRSRKTNIPLHYPLQNIKGTLKERLHPKDNGKCGEVRIPPQEEP